MAAGNWELGNHVSTGSDSDSRAAYAVADSQIGIGSDKSRLLLAPGQL